MEGITITPNRVFVRVWDKEKREYYEKDIEPEKITSFLWEEVKLEGDVSLGRLISLLKDDLENWESVLNENIVPFIEEAQKPYAKTAEEDMQYLEVYWSAGSETYDKEKSFSLWASFHGVGIAVEDDKYGAHKKGDRVNYAIEFSPVNELVHYPVKLDPKVEVVITDLDSFKETGKVSEDRLFNLGNKSFTLLDLYKAIFWELTFMGSPENRDETMEDMKQQVEDIKSGKAELIPWEEVKENIDKKLDELKNKKDKDSLGLLGE